MISTRSIAVISLILTLSILTLKWTIYGGTLPRIEPLRTLCDETKPGCGGRHGYIKSEKIADADLQYQPSPFETDIDVSRELDGMEYPSFKRPSYVLPRCSSGKPVVVLLGAPTVDNLLLRSFLYGYGSSTNAWFALPSRDNYEEYLPARFEHHHVDKNLLPRSGADILIGLSRPQTTELNNILAARDRIIVVTLNHPHRYHAAMTSIRNRQMNLSDSNRIAQGGAYTDPFQYRIKYGQMFDLGIEDALIVDKQSFEEVLYDFDKQLYFFIMPDLWEESLDILGSLLCLPEAQRCQLARLKPLGVALRSLLMTRRVEGYLQEHEERLFHHYYRKLLRMKALGSNLFPDLSMGCNGVPELSNESSADPCHVDSFNETTCVRKLKDVQMSRLKESASLQIDDEPTAIPPIPTPAPVLNSTGPDQDQVLSLRDLSPAALFFLLLRPSVSIATGLTDAAEDDYPPPNNDEEIRP